MGVTSTGSTTTNIGNEAGAEVGNNTSEKATKNGHDKENVSASNGAVKPGNESDVTATTVTADTVEIGASLNVRY